MSGMLSNMKSLNVRHIQHHLADVEGGEVIEVRRRGRPVARIVPLPSAAAPPSDWSHAEKRLRAVYPTPARGTTAAQTIADGRGER